MAKKLSALLTALYVLFFALSAQAGTSSFLDKTVTINRFHIAQAAYLFKAETPAKGILRITNTTPGKSYLGAVICNGRIYFLINDDSFTRSIPLRRLNKIHVSLLGDPGTSLHIEVLPPAPVISSFTVTPDSIVHGSTATLTWTVQNADTVSIEPAIGEVAPNGSLVVTPDATTTYTLTAANPHGSVSTTATVKVLYRPTITILEPDGFDDIADKSLTIQWEDSDPDSYAAISLYYDTDNTGEDGVLLAMGLSEDPDGVDDQFTWDTSTVPEGDYYIYAVIDDGETPAVTAYSPGPVTVFHNKPPVFTPVAEQQVMEEQQLTFTVHADDADNDPLTYSAANLPDGASFDAAAQTFSWTPALGQAGSYAPEFTATDGEASDTITVQITVVPHPPAVEITASPATITSGQSATLTWTSTYTDTCTIEPGIGGVPVNGSITVTPQQNTTYTITATGPGGTATAETTVTVVAPPTVTIHAEPASINIGQSTTLTWNATDADTVFIDQGIGDVAASGSVTVTPQTTTTYTITASSPVGTVSASATVTVGNPFTITITSPQANAFISRPDIMVLGTIENTSGNDTGVTVNDTVAVVHGNQFVANHVPLEEGENNIVITATDSAGSQYSVSLLVEAETTGDYIHLGATLESGLPAFETSLYINGTIPITSSTVTYTGPGAITLTPDATDKYTAEITDEGVYVFTAEVDHDGTLYTDAIAVSALNRIAVDARIKAKWNNMKSCLANNDIEGALDLFHDVAKDQQREVFTLLADELPGIVAAMRDIEMVTVENNRAEYRITRERIIQGQPFDITFYITFARSGDGWKIVNF